MLPGDAWARALIEHGPQADITRACEAAYALGMHLVDYDGLAVDVAAGRPIPVPAWEPVSAADIKAAFDRIAEALGCGLPKGR